MDVAHVKRKRSLYLACSAFCLLFLGLIYAFSMFAAPLCEAFDLEKSAIGLTFNIMMIAFCVGCVAGSKIERKIGLRATIILAGVLFLCGFAGTALFAQGTIMAVYCLYGVVAGFGVGIGYTIIVATTNVWFPEKVGFSSGILMMGFGLGSLILGTLSVNLVPALGMRTVLTGVAVATCAVCFVLSCILRRPPENIVALMNPSAVTDAASNYDPADDDKILKSPIFYLYYVWAIIVIAIGLATIGNCASDAQLVGLSPSFATLLVGLVSVCNGLSRIIIGAIYDRTNVVITMLVDAIVAICATFFIVAAFNMNIPALYIAGAFCCGFCYGGVPVIASAFSRQRFGSRNYSFNFSLVNFAIVFGSLLNIAIQNGVGGGGRPAVFFALAILSIVAMLDIVPFSRSWKGDLRRLNDLRLNHSK